MVEGRSGWVRKALMTSCRWRGMFLMLACCGLPDAAGGASPSGPGVGAWAPMGRGVLGGSTDDAVAAWNGTEMFVWGDLGTSGARYSSDLDRWIVAAADGSPGRGLGRFGPSIAWIDADRVLLWGGDGCGRDQASSCDDGLVYDTKRDAWSALSSKNPPRGRIKHSTIWTGHQMIIWGGQTRLGGSVEVRADGGSYDPVHDEWVSMSDRDAPSSRTSHTAVWTGRKMVIWGGYRWDEATNSSIFMNDGAVYDPAADAWVPTTLVGAPAGRSRHSAVWADGEMLVWGGDGCPANRLPEPDSAPWGACGDGAAYDPELDRWRPISRTGAPSPRVGHTAVWTGQKMVIWGGLEGDGTRGNGASYVLSTDSWEPMTNDGAPSGRGLHWAFWTGTRMLIWGGGNGHMVGGFSDGGFFTP